jgi:hypothetical protein
MERAIVRQSTMDDAGIITVNVPNSLLQKALPIIAYVCIYEDDTFKTLYEISIPVKARKQPTDYVLVDNDGEIYSFNALENMVINAIENVGVQIDEIGKNLEVEYRALQNEISNSLSDVENVKKDVENVKKDVENTIGSYNDRIEDIDENGLKRADVVNNLLSNSEDLPLSAKQGQILDDKITEINTELSSEWERVPVTYSAHVTAYYGGFNLKKSANILVPSFSMTLNLEAVGDVTEIFNFNDTTINGTLYASNESGKTMRINVIKGVASTWGSVSAGENYMVTGALYKLDSNLFI